MNDLPFQSALALSKRIAEKDISATELMQSTLSRIGQTNDRVNAIVSLRDGDTLVQEARAADASRTKGWLHGIPIAIKDLSNAAGLPSTMGSAIFANTVAEKDDIIVARLRAAGAIVIGKTNTPEFGLGSHTYNPVFGATRNPYGQDFSAGGSSGGAAAALAAGMTSVADGSDMMGSLRNPAAWNNVYGMRPSWGLVPSEPKGDDFMQQLATNGPMARNPKDLAALLDTLSGVDPRQPHGLNQAPALPQIEGPVTGTRIGWLADWDGAYPIEPGILQLCEAALGQFQDIGCKVDPLAAPFSAPAIWDSWITLRAFEVAGGMGAIYQDPGLRQHLKPAALWEIERGMALSAMQVYAASVTRSEWFGRAAQLFETYDVLALPSAQVWPFDVAQEYPKHINAIQMDTYHRWMEVVVAASLLGLPVVNVPVGFGGPHDMPMGMQLIGKRGGDAQLLRLANAWHAATDWPAARRALL